MPALMPSPLTGTIPDQFAPQYAALATMGNLLYHSTCSLAEVNASVARSMLEDAMNTSTQLLNAKSPQQYFDVLSTQLEPSLQRMRNYQQTVASIASTMQNALAGIAGTGTNATDANQVTTGNPANKEAPLSMMNPFGIMPPMLGNGDGGFGQLVKNMQTTMENAQAQFGAVAGMFMPKQNTATTG